MTLGEYLANTTARRWQLGTWDCCVFMANWLIESGLPDPMADRRSTYESPREYRQMLKSEHGLLSSCIQRFSRLGLRETNTPRAGDVAVVMAPFTVRLGLVASCPTGAICTSATQHAVVASDVALVIAAMPLVKAWGVPRA